MSNYYSRFNCTVILVTLYQDWEQVIDVRLFSVMVKVLAGAAELRQGSNFAIEPFTAQPCSFFSSGAKMRSMGDLLKNADERYQLIRKKSFSKGL